MSELKGYTVQLCEREDGDYLTPIIFCCQADSAGHAEEQALDAYPDGLLLQVICDSAYDELPPISPDDRFNPALYTQSELRQALETVGNLFDDYLRGAEVQHMEWENLDHTHRLAQIGLPRLEEANRLSWNSEDPD